MTENTPSKKVAISQFQIKNVTDVNTGPVTPVKIAPPPVTVKRAKSLKSGIVNLFFPLKFYLRFFHSATLEFFHLEFVFMNS